MSTLWSVPTTSHGEGPGAFDRFLAALEATNSRITPRGPGEVAAQCPAHDDHTASLSVSRSDTGMLVHCHTGCRTDDILTALHLQRRDLFDEPRARRAGYTVVAEYPYTDEHGQVLYLKERRWPKDFRQYRPGPDVRRTYKLGDVRRVLYRLPDVVAAIAAGQPVWLAEGEKDADALTDAGACATTWPEGAWTPGSKSKWRPEYTAALTGAHVVIVADDDEPGLHAATAIAQSLTGAAASVSVVLPAAGKDAADHLAAGHGLDDFRPLPAEPTENGSAAETSAVEASGGEGRGGRGPAQATVLRRMALERYEMVADDAGIPYAVPRTGPRIARAFRGGRFGFRAELAKLYADQQGGAVPAASALADALTALEGEAVAADPVQLALRVAEHDGAVLLDLGRADGRLVRVGPGGWRVLDPAREAVPVLFRRTALTSALPLPAPTGAGSLAPLRERLNVSDAQWPLIVGWLVAALLPTIDHPVLTLTGEQGTGKSTATRNVVQVVDPNPAPTRAMPRNVDDWAVTAAASWVIGIDNLSGLQQWQSDLICRTVTGDALPKRTHYSNDDVTIVRYQRCIVANGIDLGALKGDLADRLLLVELERITAATRRTRGAVTMNDETRAVVVSGLLDLAADVLATLPQISLPELPRMADFALILAALDEVAGLPPALPAYLGQATVTASAVVESDPVAAALRGFLEHHPGGWEGTTGALLGKLIRPDGVKAWPATERALTGALTRIAPPLRELGYTIDRLTRRSYGVPWLLVPPPTSRDRTEGQESFPAPASQPSLPSLQAADLHQRGDGPGSPTVTSPCSPTGQGPGHGVSDGSSSARGLRPSLVGTGPDLHEHGDGDGSGGREPRIGLTSPDHAVCHCGRPLDTHHPAELGPCHACSAPTHRYGTDGRPHCSICTPTTHD